MSTKRPTTLSAMLALKELFSNRRRWTQNQFYTYKHKNHCYCLIGGIEKITYEKAPDLHAQMNLQRSMVRAMGFLPGPYTTETEEAIRWNDVPGRKVSHVQLRIDEGIRRLRKRKKT